VVLFFPLAVRCGRTTSPLFTRISKAGPNFVEKSAILTEFVAAPHGRRAELAKGMHETEHAGGDTTKAT
jgi:hypothetical protein